MHLATPAYTETLRCVGILNTEGNVLEQFAVQALTQMPGSDKLALLSGEGTVVDRECHFHGGFGNFYER